MPDVTNGLDVTFCKALYQYAYENEDKIENEKKPVPCPKGRRKPIFFQDEIGFKGFLFKKHLKDPRGFRKECRALKAYELTFHFSFSAFSIQ